MTTYVLPADAVHVSAALCDYLVGRLDSDDTVHAVSTDQDSTPQESRDSQDAQNAVYARLGAIATVEQHTEPADTRTAALLAVAEHSGADEIIVDYAAQRVENGSDIEQLFAQSTWPVVGVPIAE